MNAVGREADASARVGAAIEVRGIEKRFGSRRVLQGVSLAIAPGETHVILGRSGEGKSVLLKILCGLIEPDAGCVLVDGVPAVEAGPAWRLRPRGVEGIQMLFQGGALFDSMTIAQNVAFHAVEHGQADERDALRVAAPFLAMVGLEHTGAMRPAELSGGMRKRAALARALAARPRVMLYDEPTTGLDPSTAMAINHLIRETQRRLGVTSVVVTHDWRSAREVGDRCSFLHEGRILETTIPSALARSPHAVIREFVQNAAVAP